MTVDSHAWDIQREIKDYFASVLRMPVASIATDVHVLELGADSIMLVEAQRFLQERFGCVIDMHSFFDELNTIEKIAAFVGSSRKRTAEATPAPPLPPSPPAASGRDPVFSTPERPASLGLLEMQLALVADVIEAQNRLLAQRNRSQARLDVHSPR